MDAGNAVLCFACPAARTVSRGVAHILCPSWELVRWRVGGACIGETVVDGID